MGKTAGKGFNLKTEQKRPVIPKTVQMTKLTRQVRTRAFALLGEANQKYGWKPLVHKRARSYLAALFDHTKVPSASTLEPKHATTVQLCFARACLESEVTGLTGQAADWYPGVLTAVKQAKAQES